MKVPNTLWLFIALMSVLYIMVMASNEEDDVIRPFLIEKTDFESHRDELNGILEGSQLKQSLVKGEVVVNDVHYFKIDTKSEGIADMVEDLLAKKKANPIQRLYSASPTIHRNGRSLTTEEQTNSAPAYIHHDYDALTLFLNQTVISTCPAIATLKTAGQSINGRELWYIKFSTIGDQTVPRPAFKYVGNMHGDEVVGREVLIHFIYQLCTSYGKESTDVEQRITKLLNYADVVIMPSMNPDGYDKSPHAIRQNSNMTDLNRNFPDQYTSPNVQDDYREVEVRHMMNFIRSEPFILSANLHGGALVANYPYDGDASKSGGSGTYSKSPDDSLFIQLAKSYAKNHKKMSKSSEFKDGITNGAKWYRLYGGMQDWNYVYNQIPELTLELSNIKYPAASTLEQFWLDNKEALLCFAEQMYTGVKGFVVDTDYNAVPATIQINGIDHTTKPFPAGDFYRLLSPGTYTMSVSARGYHTKTATFTIPEDQKEPIIQMIILNRITTNQQSVASAKAFYTKYVNFDVTIILIGLFAAVSLGIVATAFLSLLCYHIRKK